MGKSAHRPKEKVRALKENQQLFGWPTARAIPLDGDRPLDRDLTWIRERGFTGVEICPSWRTLDWANKAELETWTRRFERAGLHVHSLHADFEGGDFTSVETQDRVRSFSRHKRAVEVLRDLGGYLYVVDLDLSQEAPSSRLSKPWLVRAVRGLNRLIAKCGTGGVHLVVRMRVPEEGDRWDMVEWILERLPTNDVGLSMDLDADGSPPRLLDVMERRRLHLRRLEVDESSNGNPAWMHPYQLRLDDLLQRSTHEGLFIIKSPLQEQADAQSFALPACASKGAKEEKGLES